jgi:hypothetical protein
MILIWSLISGCHRSDWLESLGLCCSIGLVGRVLWWGVNSF